MNIGLSVVAYGDGIDQDILIIVHREHYGATSVLEAAVGIFVNVVLEIEDLAAAVGNLVRHAGIRKVRIDDVPVNGNGIRAGKRTGRPTKGNHIVDVNDKRPTVQPLPDLFGFRFPLLRGLAQRPASQRQEEGRYYGYNLSHIVVLLLVIAFFTPAGRPV